MTYATGSTYTFIYRSVQEMPAMYPDRVITLRGGADNVSQAEAAISLKLREAYEKELSMPMVRHDVIPAALQHRSFNLHCTLNTIQ